MKRPGCGLRRSGVNQGPALGRRARTEGHRGPPESVTEEVLHAANLAENLVWLSLCILNAFLCMREKSLYNW